MDGGLLVYVPNANIGIKLNNKKKNININNIISFIYFFLLFIYQIFFSI